MSRAKKQKHEGDGEAAAGKDKSGKGKAGTIGMAITFTLVGTVFGPKLLGTSAPAAAVVEEETTTTVPEAGEVVVLDKFTLNLSDGHLLQVGLALELAAAEEGEAGGGHGGGGEAATDDPTKGYAKAIDAAIDVLGDQTMSGLSAPGGREHAKTELAEVLESLYHGEVMGVYFHTFVMQ